jgi:hypothetical protein
MPNLRGAVIVTLDELVATFRAHLWLPDPTPLLVVLATIVANHQPGDPVWMLLVGPPSSGKTELLNALSSLPNVHEVSTFTQAGLLSAASSRNPNATGGLLPSVGVFGIVVCKDFTSLLSESSETRSGDFAALREIYDGSWRRHVGSDGGKTLAWAGKIGVLAAVTETIDRHIATIGAMGERFVFCRMPAMNADDRIQQAHAALEANGTETEARAELGAAVNAFLSPLLEREPTDSRPEALIDRKWLAQVTDLATRCRSVVERDPRDRQVELVPQPEATARLTKVLAQLGRGLQTIGVADADRCSILATIALDSLPKTRRAVVEQVVAIKRGLELSATNLADGIGLPNDVVDRTLGDLAAHGIVKRHSVSGQPHRWGPTEWLVERWQAISFDRDPVPETEIYSDEPF